ncbi:MAG: NUDIX hydrolase [Mogibacterium sp.]|nr:NUDIX hydrolase [Mogibacterium sp.]
MAFREETISSQVVYEGPVFRVRKHQVRAVGGQTDVRDIVEHIGGSVMLAVKDDGKILFERQYRKSAERDMIELPAGKRDPGESYLETAVRELEEETGYKCGSIRKFITIRPSCGYSAELLDIYLCRDLTPGDRALDPTEDIEILEKMADEAVRMILDQQIEDAKTIIGILTARTMGEI